MEQSKGEMSAHHVLSCAVESFLNFSQLLGERKSNKENEGRVNEWEGKEN